MCQSLGSHLGSSLIRTCRIIASDSCLSPPSPKLSTSMQRRGFSKRATQVVPKMTWRNTILNVARQFPLSSPGGRIQWAVFLPGRREKLPACRGQVGKHAIRNLLQRWLGWLWRQSTRLVCRAWKNWRSTRCSLALKILLLRQPALLLLFLLSHFPCRLARPSSHLHHQYKANEIIRRPYSGTFLGKGSMTEVKWQTKCNLRNSRAQKQSARSIFSILKCPFHLLSISRLLTKSALLHPYPILNPGLMALLLPQSPRVPPPPPSRVPAATWN